MPKIAYKDHRFGAKALDRIEFANKAREHLRKASERWPEIEKYLAEQ